jgi:hypothetical protein
MHSPNHSAATEIPPFWQRLPHFFRYPLYWEPLLYMGFLALATLLGFILPAPFPFDHALVHLGVWLAFFRYAYKTLDQTAQGWLTPEEHRMRDNADLIYLPYKQCGIFLVAGLVLALAYAFGSLVLGFVMIFMVLALPASVMTLVITRRFWVALNPLALCNMMRMIGLPYLGLCGFILLLSGGTDALSILLVPLMPVWLWLPALNFVSMYFMLIMFNMMGYVIYQNHHVLGLSANVPVTVDRQVEENNAVGHLIGAGRLEEALAVAYEAYRVAAHDDVAAHERYHKLLVLTGHNDRMLSHAPSYLSLLLEKNLGDEALALYRFVRERAPALELEQPAQLLRLAEAARRQRNFAEALALIKGFDKRFPRHRDIPSVYFLAASILCENLHQDKDARRILVVLLARYPDHPVCAEAQQLLTVLDKLAVTAN